MPDSMIVVHNKTSYSRSTNEFMTASLSASVMRPCAEMTRASGTARRMPAANASISLMRRQTKKTCPPRFSSFRIASRTIPQSKGRT